MSRYKLQPDPKIHPAEGLLFSISLRRAALLLLAVPSLYLLLKHFDLGLLFWFLAYGYVAAALIFEPRNKRSKVIRHRKHRDDFQNWIAHLAHAPQAAQEYWMTMFAMVEETMLLYHPDFWHKLNEMQRWVIVDHFEQSAHKRAHLFMAQSAVPIKQLNPDERAGVDALRNYRPTSPYEQAFSTK
jgi:hypothetical protein